VILQSQLGFAEHVDQLCPTGKSIPSSTLPLSSPSAKNISLNTSGKSAALVPVSRPTEGRLAIVTDAGRDAVDADAPLTNGARSGR